MYYTGLGEDFLIYLKIADGMPPQEAERAVRQQYKLGSRKSEEEKRERIRAYQHDYYMRVTKPKRQSKRKG